jgi:hypothetical protein
VLAKLPAAQQVPRGGLQIAAFAGDAIEQVLMHQIRREGGYWEDIGAGFGITKQTAHQRFYRCLPAPVPSDIEELLLKRDRGTDSPQPLHRPAVPARSPIDSWVLPYHRLLRCVSSALRRSRIYSPGRQYGYS